MWETVGKPQSFQDVQDSDYFPLQEDNTYHGFTVGSDGEFLKPMSHGTTWKEVMNAHLNTDPFFQQNRIIKNEKGRLQYVPNEDEEYIETELSPEEIQEYAKGGYIVEDISVPSLTKAQRGLFKKKDKQDPNKLEYREPVKVEDDLVESVTPFPEAPEDFKKGVANLKEVEAGPYWLGISREYSGKHNKQAFIDKKKRQYLRNTNRGLAKAAGLSMENFPKNVEKNFINEYNYNRNNYVVKKLFKNAGISPNKREEWADKISDADRALIANSKYGNKLKPSIWARTLAGLGTMASKFSPEIADAMERGDLPGLTREEQRAIKNAKIKGIPVGGVEALAGADAVGVALANAVEASGNESYGGDYKKAPGLLSGDVMPKITDDQIAVLNPSTYTVGYDFAPLGKGLLKGATKIGKASVSAGKAGIKAGKKFGKNVSNIKAKSILNPYQDGGETDFYTVKGSKGVYRKVNGQWEVDWDKSGNFQPLSKGDVKKRSEQLNKNAELLFDPNYSDLISSQNLEYKAAPKEELKKKLTSGQTAAQKVFAKDFKVSGKDRLGKAEDKIEKGVADYVKYHNENFDRPLTQQDIDNARETISNNIMASEGVYDPSAGKFNRNASTIANEDSEYIMKTDFPENASFGNYAQRGWEYLTNPFTAAEYIVSGGGAGNMPFNINELRMAGIDPGVVEGRNIVGNTLNTSTNLFDAGDKVIRNTLAGNYGTAVLEAMRFLPVAGYADDLIKFIGRNVDDVARLAKKSKTPLQNIAENVETVNDVISSTPGVPRPPLPNSELILNRFNQLLNEGDSALVARAAIADEFGIDAINVLNNTPPIPSQPIYTGSIDLRRPTSNQLPDIPETLNIPIEQTGVRPVTQLENDVQQMLQETALNLNHPEYQIPNSFDDFISSLRGGRYSTQYVEQLANNTRYRDYYNSLRARQQASSSPELNDLFSDPSTYLRGEQNINIRPNVDYTDKINRIAQGILYPETLTQLNTLNVTGKAKSAAKTLGKKLSDFKSNLNTAINKANVKLGEVIDKSKIETLKKPINSKDIDNEVNKYLAEGLGIKKGDVQIKVKTKPDGTTQVLIKPKEFFKKNKQLIEDTYGKGSFDEWINTVSDDWIDSGYLGLKSTSGERVQPRKLTEILSGKKLEPSVDFGYGVMNVPTPGLKRAGDFPFANWEGGFRENLLENLGVSGELTQAYNKALKGKGYGIYSGGTGHLTPGAKRYVRELLNNRVEVMNPDRAEDLYRLLNDESTMKAVNNALKNKNEPLPASVYQAIQPLVFKYKRKGGSINNDFIESELSQKEIDKLVAQGYIVETVD
jgi:hypothetical protein